MSTYLKARFLSGTITEAKLAEIWELYPETDHPDGDYLGSFFNALNDPPVKSDDHYDLTDMYIDDRYGWDHAEFMINDFIRYTEPGSVFMVYEEDDSDVPRIITFDGTDVTVHYARIIFPTYTEGLTDQELLHAYTDDNESQVRTFSELELDVGLVTDLRRVIQHAIQKLGEASPL